MPGLKAILAAAMLVSASVPVALAQSKTAAAVLPGAEVRGAATLRFLGFPLYQARLFTVGGAALNWSQNFGIELTYLRDLTQYDLVEATLREFKRTGGALPLEAQLNTCFKAVGNGDRYLAVSDGANKVAFWRNGQRTCTLSHPQIKRRFMGIFVGENTRSKSFTRKLLGS
ncbi:chalcone isomerase family protein [Aliiroseovarius sediminis]|uniref:chalcone isomerase family protein n=1 Tax=Aliiroseovarius sediminis TaxID=2925839 RepID=UPI001F56809B|nr:chalcone isomerase family protein [Aliiroseovarius sediminis]MCI2395403.1 chalcone isomerase family protein [Aliiroseovarius sediminis]